MTFIINENKYLFTLNIYMLKLVIFLYTKYFLNYFFYVIIFV